MSEPTKAQLIEELTLESAQTERWRTIAEQAKQALNNVDAEALALSKIVAALKPLQEDRWQAGRSGGAVRRVLDAAYARHGMTPEWREVEVALMRLNETNRLGDDERAELQRLRQAVRSFEGVAFPQSYEMGSFNAHRQ